MKYVYTILLCVIVASMHNARGTKNYGLTPDERAYLQGVVNCGGPKAHLAGLALSCWRIKNPNAYKEKITKQK